MRLNLKLNQLAIHYIDKTLPGPKYGSEVQESDILDPTIVDFLLTLVGKVWHAPDTGSTRSGHFKSNGLFTLWSSTTSLDINKILQENDDFLEFSRHLAKHLYEQTPATASPGLLALMHLTHTTNRTSYLSILKIRHQDENFVRMLDDALTRLEVEHVQNLLLDDIQKGALVPHPQRQDYDLKVIDRQASYDPARYFTENFLGCTTKKSDEHQVKRLLPALREYAQARGLSFAIEKIPCLLETLQDGPANVTTETIINAVQVHQLFGPEFQASDFSTYLKQESALGAVDVPKNRFIQRGRVGKRSRNLTFYLRDPEFRGVSISGPPQVLANILHVEGDTVTFRIQTTKDGYDFRYE